MRASLPDLFHGIEKAVTGDNAMRCKPSHMHRREWSLVKRVRQWLYAAYRLPRISFVRAWEIFDHDEF